MSTPEPLTPPECDLRGMPFMPLDVVRLTDSDLFALSTGEEFKAALTLWCKAWLQVPAASLPDDDRILAHLSGTGPRWKKLKDMALRGFVKCSDGRYYHSVIAEKAGDAWQHRLRQRERAAKRWDKKTPDTGNATASEDDATAQPTHIPRQCKGEGQLSKEKPSTPNIKVQPSRANPTRSTDCLNEVCEAARWHPRTDEARIEALSVIDGWLAEGFDFRLDILAGIGRAIGQKPSKTSSLKRFTTTIRGIHADRGHSRPRNGTSVLPRTEGADPEVAAGIRDLSRTLASRLGAA